jgi:acyl-[acyl-carrier-protein]-phospholipid O-acyltransferase/long-chain-fatty-acid--[acyl-carrier-protein] ligase
VASILSNRDLRGHVGAQFFGAFNDNLFKQLILFLAARKLFPDSDQQGVAFAAFALPFVLFSGLAGDLSERYSKRAIIVWMKVWEIGLMGLGVWALQSMSWGFMLALLFLMGMQSAFFGPSKYGVIPEIVEKDALLKANGLVSMTTFLSILLGQALAGPLLDGFGDDLWVSGLACVVIAGVGTLMATRIRPLRPAAPDTRIHRNLFSSVFKSMGELRRDPRLMPVLLLNSMFWFTGGVIQQAITGLGAEHYLAIPDDQNIKLSLLMVTLALAIMAGSLTVPRLRKVLRTSQMVRIGAWSMLGSMASAYALIAALPGSAVAYWGTHALLAALGFTGAFFAVPVQTFLQDAPPEGERGKAFAVNNFLNFLLIFLAGGFYWGASALKIPPALTSAVAAALMCGLLLYVGRHVGGMDGLGGDAQAATAQG